MSWRVCAYHVLTPHACHLQVERLDDLVPLVDSTNYARTCLYLTSCCTYLPEPDDQKVLEVAHAVYTKVRPLWSAAESPCWESATWVQPAREICQVLCDVIHVPCRASL